MQRCALVAAHLCGEQLRMQVRAFCDAPGVVGWSGQNREFGLFPCNPLCLGRDLMPQFCWLFLVSCAGAWVHGAFPCGLRERAHFYCVHLGRSMPASSGSACRVRFCLRVGSTKCYNLPVLKYLRVFALRHSSDTVERLLRGCLAASRRKCSLRSSLYAFCMVVRLAA